MNEEELTAIRRLALDYVDLLYDGKIYSFTGHNIRRVYKTCNIWRCEVNLYKLGPIVGILEIDIEYYNKREYFVNGYQVKKPILNDTRTYVSEKYKDLLWRISDIYSKYTEEFYPQFVRFEVLESKDAYYTIYKIIEPSSKTLMTYLVLKFNHLLKPIGYNNLGDSGPYCQSFSYLPENLSLEKFNMDNFKF